MSSMPPGVLEKIGSFITTADVDNEIARYWQTGDLKATTSTVADGLEWLLCNGQAVSRANYARLFNEIGTRFGAGDGVTTFNLPDYQNKSLIGASATHPQDTTGGEQTHVLTVAEMPSHAHGNYAGSGGGFPYAVAGNGNLLGPITQNAGGGGAHNNMPPWAAINWLIKT